MSLSPEPMLISIVIPVYNSEYSIGKLVDDLVMKLSSQYQLEIVLVNDNSPDNSEEVCISLHNKYRNIVSLYSLSRNFGEHNAVMAGLNNISGEYAVIMDDDFQNPVSEVLKLINYATENTYEVVYSYYEHKKHASFRNFVSRINAKVANILLNKPADLYLSSFKIINKKLAKKITRYTLPFPYVDGLILDVTNKIGRIEVRHDERKTGKSNYTARKMLALWSNMVTNFSIIPLRISVIMGFIFSFAGLLLGIQAIIWKFTEPDIPIGYTGLIVALSIFAGVQLLAIGMLGEYLGRIFLSLNGKSQYFISMSYPRDDK